MTIKTKEVKYTECDGCGYGINTDLYYTTLDLAWQVGDSRGKIPFHFHAAGKHDCLRYWMTGAGIMEGSFKERNLSEEIQDELLKSLRYRNKTKAA